MGYDYIKAFKKGHYYNKKVAMFLSEFGIQCRVPELQIAKNFDEVKEMTLTEKDIILDAAKCILEVKSSSRTFGWDPKEFPYETTIVDTVGSYESKLEKPAAYVLVSQTTGAMVVLPPSSKDRWKKIKLFDKQQNLWDEFYLINKDDIRSITSLVDWLIIRQG